MEDAERAPSLLAILKGYDWHERAACYDEPDGRTFFPEPQSKRSDAASPAMLLPLLFCLDCPVRRECLEEPYRPTTFQHGTYERAAFGKVERNWRGLPDTHILSPISKAEVRGIWGGTTDLERYEVRKLPTKEAIEYLDARVDGQIERRIRAYLKGKPHRVPRRILGRIDVILKQMGWTGEASSLRVFLLRPYEGRLDQSLPDERLVSWIRTSVPMTTQTVPVWSACPFAHGLRCSPPREMSWGTRSSST